MLGSSDEVFVTRKLHAKVSCDCCAVRQMGGVNGVPGQTLEQKKKLLWGAKKAESVQLVCWISLSLCIDKCRSCSVNTVMCFTVRLSADLHGCCAARRLIRGLLPA